MKVDLRFGLLAAAALSVTPALAQVPISGDYQCKMEFMHMMPGASGVAMVSAASCVLEGDNTNTTSFTNNVLFDNKGQGKLINSNGIATLDGEPASAYVGVEAAWTLQMKDGEVTGYSGKGVNDIVAGENVGKQIHWSVTPTGPDTATISYEIKD